MTRRLPTLLFATTLAACTSHAPRPELAPPKVLLLGEVHDNAAGHATRATLLRERIDAGWRPAIAMEQFDTDQQPALDAALKDCADAACVIAKVAPAKSSWQWDYYRPVIQLALDHKLPLLAANLSRAAASKVVKEGVAAVLPPPLVSQYRLNALPADVLAAQETEVRDSHCGMLPESMVSPMAKAQIARDVVMTDTLRPYAKRGVVLIAGNGHVRNDFAVPFWLRFLGIPSQAIGFLETGNSASKYDKTRAIPAQPRTDPCAGFKPPAPAGQARPA